MQQYHKVGNRQGRPAYRTPSSFKTRAALTTKVAKIQNPNFQGQTKSKIRNSNT
ncbi:hypothetical protein GYA13_03185 [Candidatus Kuenenbacteria bacterium]|nr:hypothetical protein [Candidatus Kuenenbacteria bacterium]